MRHLFKELTILFLLFVPILLFGNRQDSVSGVIIRSQNEKISDRCAQQLKMADLYLQLKDFDNALLALRTGSTYCENSTDVFYVEYAVSQVYLQKGELSAAYEHLIKFKEDGMLKQDTMGIVLANYGLGSYYSQTNNISQAIAHYQSALSALERNKNKELEGLVLLGLSKLYLNTGDYVDGKSYAQRALGILNNTDNKGLKADCFYVFSQLYEKLGDYQSAHYYTHKYISLKDSISNAQLLALLSQLKTNQDFQDNKQAIETLEQENYSLNTYWLKAKNTGFVLFIISILLFVLIVILFFLFRFKIKVSKSLKRKNLELQKLNGTKDKFFSIIAHDLKSPFNSLMGFSEMLSLHAETKSHADIMEYSRIIHNSTRKLFSLVETLLQWSRTQIGATEYKPDKLDVKFVCSNIVSILKINAEEKDIVISLTVDREIIAWADKDLFSAVVRNLISNAIKFSRIGSVINVASSVKNNEVTISVSDSGVGISEDNLDKIFRVDTNVSTAGTLNEKGTGLGLVLCKEFVEINQGKIWVESKLEKGSTFKFTLPLYGK